VFEENPFSGTSVLQPHFIREAGESRIWGNGSSISLENGLRIP